MAIKKVWAAFLNLHKPQILKVGRQEVIKTIFYLVLPQYRKQVFPPPPALRWMW